MLLKPLRIAIAATLATGFVGSAFAADASCTALIKATVPDPKVPYRVTMTMLNDGKPQVSESVNIDGFLYVRQGNAKTWSKIKMPDTKALVEESQSSLSGCTAGGTEQVGTTPTRVWTANSVDPYSKKTVNHKVWIGVADSRVYRQKIDDMDQLLSYTNVTVPAPLKP